MGFQVFGVVLNMSVLRGTIGILVPIVSAVAGSALEAKRLAGIGTGACGLNDEEVAAVEAVIATFNSSCALNLTFLRHPM